MKESRMRNKITITITITIAVLVVGASFAGCSTPQAAYGTNSHRNPADVDNFVDNVCGDSDSDSMLQCLQNEYRKVDASLTKNYLAARSAVTGDSALLNEVLNSERSWITYRNDECSLFGSPGLAEHMDQMDEPQLACVVRLTDYRSTELSRTAQIIKARPTVSQVNPPRGTLGTPVTISGRNLNSITQVWFDGISAAGQPMLDSGGSLHVVVPTNINDTGSIPIAFSYNQGNGITGKVASSVSFSVVQPQPAGPSATSVQPSSGKVGTPVTILGTGLSAVRSVLFGGVSIIAGVLPSDTQLNVVVPPGVPVGGAEITLVTANGSVDSGLQFTVTSDQGSPSQGNGITAASVQPSSATPGTPVIITGTGLSAVTSVSFGGIFAIGAFAPNDSELHVVVPQNAPIGSVGISFSTGHGNIDSGLQFTVLDNSGNN
jgi:uncharacterized protein YecT (DUF1311 family)